MMIDLISCMYIFSIYFSTRIVVLLLNEFKGINYFLFPVKSSAFLMVSRGIADSLLEVKFRSDSLSVTTDFTFDVVYLQDDFKSFYPSNTKMKFGCEEANFHLMSQYIM